MARLGFCLSLVAGFYLAGCAQPHADAARPGRTHRQSSPQRCRQDLILVRADRSAVADSSIALPESVAKRARRFTVAVRTIRTGTSARLTAGTSPSVTDGAPSRDALVEGTGVVIDSQGLILTNHHVVRRALNIQVWSAAFGWMPGTVIAEDALNDLAIVSVFRPMTGAASLGDADATGLNQPVVAVGFTPGQPVEDGPTFLAGKVTGVGRSLQKALDPSNTHYYGDLIESTVPLQAGHSGGPLLDVTGNVVGINTAAVTHRLTGRRTGYAVPMTAGIRNLVQRMLTGQPVAHGYLGVTVCTCPIHRGSVTIDDILPNSPAHHAGLRSGDAIVRWNDTPVHSAAHLAKLVHAQQPGQTASLLTQRTGRISVTLDRRP